MLLQFLHPHIENISECVAEQLKLSWRDVDVLFVFLEVLRASIGDLSVDCHHCFHNLDLVDLVPFVRLIFINVQQHLICYVLKSILSEVSKPDNGRTINELGVFADLYSDDFTSGRNSRPTKAS